MIRSYLIAAVLGLAAAAFIVCAVMHFGDPQMLSQ